MRPAKRIYFSPGSSFPPCTSYGRLELNMTKQLPLDDET
jgi:hypothetical protein